MLKKINKVFAIAIALTFAVGGTSMSASADEMGDWKRAVAKKVAKKQKYPRAALAREIEGKAKIRLTVMADGSISTHEVVQETGESILDKEIPKLVKRLNPLPALPDAKTELSFVLPLSWTLN
ncbi:energy transducer TonB [Kordiimonas aquimaris]|uniref:energy transducer TonB n=1 Tax=Kordiimonas aquimaris TaxID=707591 RepID=UPI0021D0FB40|nr:energy transducer TonB [Kordiimonas aquimaris]